MTDSTLAGSTYAFLLRCRCDEGGYNASPDPAYPGRSDTGSTDIAAPVYAAVIARTLGVELPEQHKTVDFLQSRQRKDGAFANRRGAFDPSDDLAMLYNTTQAVVGLRALGVVPTRSPLGVMDRFFEGGLYATLPWYTTSFYPLVCAALGAPFPADYRDALAGHMVRNQAEDGYVGDHVAATFHMAHFYRLLGEPTPRSDAMIDRVLRDQTADGGWDIREPDWDVHACFDAAFILRQLGGGREDCARALKGAGKWALRCRNEDGGFGHFPGEPSDIDATYFQFGALWQAGMVEDSDREVEDGHLLGWGHAMTEAEGPLTSRGQAE